MKTEGITPSYVEWLDVAEIDASFADDVPGVPRRAQQANFDSLIDTATDDLFHYEPPSAFASFAPFDGYIKHLFQRKVLDSFNTDEAIEKLDKIEEDPTSEKIVEMLYTLDDLNDLLETIHCKILSTLKP